MSLLKYWGDTLLFIALCLGGIVFLGRELHQDLDKEGIREARRIERLVEPTLQKAHQAKDGIALQEVVQNVVHLPGMSMAAVLDSEKKVLAHSRLSEVGKVVPTLGNGKDTWSFPQLDSHVRWGTFVFALSSRDRQGLWQHHMNLLMTGILGSWVLFILWSRTLHGRIQGLETTLRDRQALLSEEKKNTERLEDHISRRQKNHKTVLRSALNRISEPWVVCDDQQRVLAVNHSALMILYAHEKDFLEKAWMDIPILQSAGPWIEKSLQSPGLEVSGPEVLQMGLHSIVTLPDGAATWIRMRSEVNIVKLEKQSA